MKKSNLSIVSLSFGLLLATAIMCLFGAIFISPHDSNFVTALFTGISTVVIIITGWYAINDFWLTKDKARADATFALIDEWSNKTLIDERIYLHDLFVPESDWGKQYLNALLNNDSHEKRRLINDIELPKRIHYLQIFLEKIGLAIKYDRLNVDILFNNLYLELEDFRVLILEYNKVQQNEQINAWTNIDYLYKQLDIFKKNNKL